MRRPWEQLADTRAPRTRSPRSRVSAASVLVSKPVAASSLRSRLCPGGLCSHNLELYGNRNGEGKREGWGTWYQATNNRHREARALDGLVIFEYTCTSGGAQHHVCLLPTLLPSVSTSLSLPCDPGSPLLRGVLQPAEFTFFWSLWLIQIPEPRLKE